MNKYLFKGNEVAERLNFSCSQVFVLMRRRDTPTVRFSDRSIRVWTEDLEFFVDNNSVSVTKNLPVTPTASKSKQVVPIINYWVCNICHLNPGNSLVCVERTQ